MSTFLPVNIPNYGCALLLGEHWDLSLVVFWNWQDKVGMCISSVEECWRYDEPSWCGKFWGGVWPKVLTSLASGVEPVLLSSTLTLAVLLLIILSVVLAQWPRRVFSGDPALTTVAVLLLLLITGVTAIIWRQPQSPSPLTFRVRWPYVPKVSTLSEWSLCALTSKHPLLDQEKRGVAETNGLFPDPHSVLTNQTQ